MSRQFCTVCWTTSRVQFSLALVYFSLKPITLFCTISFHFLHTLFVSAIHKFLNTETRRHNALSFHIKLHDYEGVETILCICIPIPFASLPYPSFYLSCFISLSLSSLRLPNNKGRFSYPSRSKLMYLKTLSSWKTICFARIWNVKLPGYLTQWSRGLVLGSAAARLLETRVRIPPRAWMSSLPCECCVLWGRRFWDEPITRPDESHRVWCVQWVWSRNLDKKGALLH